MLSSQGIYGGHCWCALLYQCKCVVRAPEVQILIFDSSQGQASLQCLAAVLISWFITRLFCARLLSVTAPEEQGALVFAAVFFVVWFGAAVVTLNAQLLGGTM